MFYKARHAVYWTGALLASLLCGRAGAGDVGELQPHEIARRYVSRTLMADRFDRPFHMKYRMDAEYPEKRPQAYVEWIEYEHWSSAPACMLVGRTGPFRPHQTVGGEVHTHIWNGQSEVNHYSSTRARDDRMTMSRGTVSSDLARSNKYLAALGLPQTAIERDEAANRNYWITTAISEDNGYRWRAATEEVNGIPCRVIHKSVLDTLWFNCSDPERPRLVKRDVWKNTGTVRREVYRFSEDSREGVPRLIIKTEYEPVNRTGEQSAVLFQERLSLGELTFGPIRAKFSIDVAVGTDVLDLNSLTTYKIQEAQSLPFEKVLSTTTIRSRPWVSRMVVWLNVAALGGVALVFGLRRLKAS